MAGQRIKLRRDTAANWTASNPVLQAGEIGFDSTNQLFNIGDGASTWGALVPFKKLKKYSVFRAYATTITQTYATGLTAIVDEKIYLSCVTANNGYAIGDLIQAQPTAVALSISGLSVTVSTAGTVFTLLPKAGGTTVSAIAANWQIYIVVWGN